MYAHILQTSYLNVVYIRQLICVCTYAMLYLRKENSGSALERQLQGICAGALPPTQRTVSAPQD